MKDRGTVALCGLGLVGHALARRLAAGGWSVVGYDLRAEACDAFRAAGHSVAPSLRELGGAADTALLAVFDTADVLSVLEANDGLLAPGHTVHTVIDCSTGDPAQLEPLCRRLAAKSVDFIEAPLSGSSQQIADGAATLLLGGDSQVIARAEPLLAALAARRIHVGAAGMGARAKLATNLVLGLNRAALAEGMVFAQSLGISAEAFLQLVLASPARSAAAESKGPLMVKEDFAPQSRIRQHLKDVELMLQAAQSAGAALPLSQTHAQLMRDAVAAGDGDLDNAAILRQIRRAGGHNPD